MDKIEKESYLSESSRNLNHKYKSIQVHKREISADDKSHEKQRLSSDRNANYLMTNLVSDCDSPSLGLLRKRTHVVSKQLTYSDILLTEKNSEKLIQTFTEEVSDLEKSDALLYEYNYSRCFKQLSKGYSLMYCDYSELSIRTAKLRTSESYFSVFEVKKREQRCKYSKLRGIVLGSNTSTFKLYQQNFGELTVLGLESYRCITLITENRNYSFGSLSVSQLYDLFIVFSMQLSIYNPLPSNLPLKKRQFTVYIVKQKLIQMASERHLFLKEFLLLGIAKTLHVLNFPEHKKSIVKNILDRSMDGSSKLLRLCFKLRPSHFKPTVQFNQNKHELVRIYYLQGKLATYFRRRIGNYKQYSDWETIKSNILSIFKLPTIKNIAMQMIKTPKLYVKRKDNYLS